MLAAFIGFTLVADWKLTHWLAWFPRTGGAGCWEWRRLWRYGHCIGTAIGGGSGWVLLTFSPRDNRLINQWAADHTTMLAGARPILALDTFEHSYHIDYGAGSAPYVDAFMEVICWDNVVNLYERYSREA